MYIICASIYLKVKAAHEQNDMTSCTEMWYCFSLSPPLLYYVKLSIFSYEQMEAGSITFRIYYPFGQPKAEEELTQWWTMTTSSSLFFLYQCGMMNLPGFLDVTNSLSVDQYSNMA